MASEAISECLIFKIFLGEYAHTPPYSLFTIIKRTQWPYQPKIAGAGPVYRECGDPVVTFPKDYFPGVFVGS